MSIERIKDLAGSVADLIPEEEALKMLESVESKIGRPLKASEGHFLVSVIEGRKKYLDKQAGAHQPKFEAAMYGADPKARYADNDED